LLAATSEVETTTTAAKMMMVMMMMMMMMMMMTTTTTMMMMMLMMMAPIYAVQFLDSTIQQHALRVHALLIEDIEPLIPVLLVVLENASGGPETKPLRLCHIEMYVFALVQALLMML